MAKLHELLAIDSNLKGQADKARTDLMNTFDKKKHHFSEIRKTFKPNDENGAERTEEQLDLQTTVPDELRWIAGFLVKSFDAAHQIDIANTTARGDIVLEDGSHLLTGLPATSLLQLEKRVAELHTFIAAIPTLDPAKGFRADPDRGAAIFKAREVRKTRTQKRVKVLVKYEATKEHPAQTELVSEDAPVGELLEQEWSGLITVTQKGEMLERVEYLQRAVKQARARANEIEIDTHDNQIGRTLVSYVFGV